MKCSDEISIGDYVRTNDGIIGKYVKYRGWQDTIETNNKWIGFDIDKDIVKHSKDIIDLVCEGDYVNGEPVEKIETGLDWGREITTTTEYLTNNEDIQSIITKEQIKQIEFRIGD